MRWRHNDFQPQLGDERVRWAWLWLPKRICGETRWMERACWREKYVEGIDFSPGLCPMLPPPKVCFWTPLSWGPELKRSLR